MVRSAGKWRAVLGSPAFILLGALAACGGPAAGPQSSSAEAMSFARSEWSAPVPLDLGPGFAIAQAPALSPDGESLYFASAAAGGHGGGDIWVSRRQADGTWGGPVNLPAPVNSPFNDGGPYFSVDGHLLFFTSNRAGSSDIYLTTRTETHDDLAWGEAVALGPEVNTAAFEAGPAYLQNAEDGTGNLYFSRGPSGPEQDIYVAPVGRDGATLGPARKVEELSSSSQEAKPSIRRDGREVYFWSVRPDFPGGPVIAGDIFVSTRAGVHDPWSPPQRLAAPVNSPAVESQPCLSPDGRTLIFVGGVPGGGGLFMSTRTPSGH